MSWSDGYVTDIGYTAGFYREMAPPHLAFAAALVGRSPGRALEPKRVLELGFGQGFGLALQAAANPGIAFEGYDFNPEHVAHARRLIEGAKLEDLVVWEAGFEDVAARDGENDVDVITLHGIFSWVSRAAQDAIVAIARQRLQPDGVLYVSYNSMPGWAPLAPIRQLMLQVKRRQAGTSDRQLSAALEVLTTLREAPASFFAANPLAAQQATDMLRLDRVYLAHEYLGENWDLFQSSEVADRLSAARLTFVASATLLENIDQYAAPPSLAQFIAGTDDRILRETLRDYGANRRFRRDVFARGTAAMGPGEHRRMLSRLRFALAVPREVVSFTFAGPLGELKAVEAMHRPIIDLLARKVAGFDELVTTFPGPAETKVGRLLDCLALLVSSGQVLPVAPGDAADLEPAQRFNRVVFEAARTGRFFSHLASPVVGGGLPVSDLDLLALAALHDGADEEPSALATRARAILLETGRHPVRDGALLDSDSEALAFLAERFEPLVERRLPLWRRLGAL